MKPTAASRSTATRCIFAAGEAVLVALDARTGREVWTSVVADNAVWLLHDAGAARGGRSVMVGASGGEFGIRGFIAGFDPETGKELWRTYTVPAPGEPGSETWPKGDHWKTGGAPVWVTGNYDPETNLAYWGTGNGGPTIGDQRPGDNLYVASMVALDVATGEMKGHHQYHQNDSWDWDEVSPPILVDFRRNGRTDQGTDRRRARRLHLVPRAQQRPHSFRRRQAVCFSERLSRCGSGQWTTRRGSGTQADDGQARGLLSRHCTAGRTGRRSRSARGRG